MGTDGVLRLVLNRVDIPNLTLPVRHDLESQVQHVALTDCLSDGASSRHSWMRSVLASEPQYTPRTCPLAEISEVSADTLTEEPAAECSPCDESCTELAGTKLDSGVSPKVGHIFPPMVTHRHRAIGMVGSGCLDFSWLRLHSRLPVCRSSLRTSGAAHRQ